MYLNEEEKKLYCRMLEDKDFKDQYFYSYLDRFVYTTAEIEKDLNVERKNVVESLLTAFNKALSYEDRMGAMDIQTVADIINEPQGYLGFRKINVSAGAKAEWTPVPPREIYPQLYNLLNNYYNLWSGLENVYEREALLHIYLMRIHPLEDGNKRLSKIILNANLVKEGLPPVIIDEFDIDEYYGFINHLDVDGFSKFIAKRSKIEYSNVISLYKSAHNVPIGQSIFDYLDMSEKSL